MHFHSYLSFQGNWSIPSFLACYLLKAKDRILHLLVGLLLWEKLLTLSWRRPISYRSQSIDLFRKSMDWFLYDIGLRHERFKYRKMRFLKHIALGTFQKYITYVEVVVKMEDWVVYPRSVQWFFGFYLFSFRNRTLEVFLGKGVLKM